MNRKCGNYCLYCSQKLTISPPYKKVKPNKWYFVCVKGGVNHIKIIGYACSSCIEGGDYPEDKEYQRMK